MKALFSGFPRPTKLQLHTVEVCSLVRRFGGELAPLIDLDHSGQADAQLQSLQDLDYPLLLKL